MRATEKVNQKLQLGQTVAVIFAQQCLLQGACSSCGPETITASFFIFTCNSGCWFWSIKSPPWIGTWWFQSPRSIPPPINSGAASRGSLELAFFSGWLFGIAPHIHSCFGLKELSFRSSGHIAKAGHFNFRGGGVAELISYLMTLVQQMHTADGFHCY